MHQMKTICWTFIFIVGLAWGEQILFEYIKEIKAKIDQELEDEGLREAIEWKCEINGGENAFDELLVAKSKLESCVETLFNFSEILEAFHLAKQNGTLNEVVDLYCNKTVTVKNCINDTSLIIENCFNEKEKPSLRFLFNIVQSFAEFTCYRDGDCVIFFVADGGPECLQSKNSEINGCFKDALGDIDITDVSFNSLPLLVNYTTMCRDYSKLQTCVVKTLETCDDFTPANVIDALFKFILHDDYC